MRKLLVVIMLFASLYVSAQPYKLQFGQREPTFYYWGEHWLDHCRLGYYVMGCPIFQVNTPIMLRFFETQDSLRIIGVAGCCGFKYEEWQRWKRLLPGLPPEVNGNLGDCIIFDTFNRLPEYFQLYKATSSSPVLLAETRWDTATPRYQIDFWIDPRHPTDSILLYEAFFENPVVVKDSFFVGGTYNNNYYHYDETSGYGLYLEHTPTYYFGMTTFGGYNDSILARPCPMTPHNGMTVKYFPQRYTYYDEHFMQWLEHFDTNWHVNSHEMVYANWLWFFPIIDTTGMGLDGFQWVPGYGCDTVRTFHLLYVEGRTAYLSWNANADALFYEVSYGPEGTAPDQGVKVRRNTSMAVLDSLEPGRYVAYVRAHCAENAKSVWTDGVTFRIEGSVGAIGEEPSLADRYTAVMPNPATTQATVASSFAIHRIELYTAAGRHLQTMEPRGYMAAVDLTGLPAGVYLVRVQTAAGETIKKLVKR